MQCISHYKSPLGAITLAADEKGLTGLWFDGEKYFGNTLEADRKSTRLNSSHGDESRMPSSA